MHSCHSKAYKAVVLRIAYEIGRVRVVESAVSGIVNSYILLFPFCVLHLVSANAKGKFMKQVNVFLTNSYLYRAGKHACIDFMTSLVKMW
jgi:hypothetical protein